MNDNRFAERDDRRREKLAELDELVKEAASAQEKCNLITARLAGCVAELQSLKVPRDLPPETEEDQICRQAREHFRDAVRRAPKCPRCRKPWFGDPGQHMVLTCICGHHWQNPLMSGGVAGTTGRVDPIGYGVFDPATGSGSACGSGTSVAGDPASHQATFPVRSRVP